MNRRLITIGSLMAIAALSASCANRSSRHQSDPSKHDEAALQRGLEQAAAEATEIGRKPASNETVAARVSPDFAGLRKELRMVVFPKTSNMTSKTSKPMDVEFSKPETYTFHAQRLGKCSDIATQKVKDLSNREAFASLRSEKSLNCAAIHVVRTEPALRPATFSNDLIGMTIYLDSEYRAYGTDTEIAYNRKNIKRVTLKQDPLETLSSGLSLFPIDLPNTAAAAKAQRGPMEIPNDAYVKNKMRKLAAAPSCTEGTVFKFRDTYGNPARVGWCQGDRWPSVIETNRFFAVIKSKN